MISSVDFIFRFFGMAKVNLSNVREGGAIAMQKWWAHLDSNQGPKDYESSALTN
jgi:hypothetical protein